MKRLWFMFIAVCLLLPGTASAANEESSAIRSAIASVLSDGTPLLEDGSVWVTYRALPLHMNLNLVAIAGSTDAGYGIDKDGKLIQWSSSQAPQVVPDVSGVKQITYRHWLLSDGTLWQMGTAGKRQLENFKGTAAFDVFDGIIGAVSDSGEIKYYESNYTSPVVLSKISDATSVRKIKVTDKQVAVLYADGRVVLHDTYNVDRDLKYVPETLATDGLDISFGKDTTLLVVKKDGTVWNNGTGLKENKYNLKQINNIDHIQKVVADQNGQKFYAYQNSGSWVSYYNGNISQVKAPYIESLTFKVSNNMPKVGDKMNVTIQYLYSTGSKVRIPLSQAQVTIDKPHLLQPLEDGSIKSVGVGEATMTVEADGIKQSLKITSSLKNPLENAKQVKGIKYLPLKSVVKALGGTVNYEAGTKSFQVQVGTTLIGITKGSEKAKVNDSIVTMKGAPIENKGETLFSADLLTTALGAKLNLDASKQEMNVSLGAGQMTVRAESKTKNSMLSSGSGKLYEAAATGDMAGWRILKGHPYEKSIRIYFKYQNGMIMSEVKDIRKVNLKQKVTWIDDSGRKRTNTVKEIYEIFHLASGKGIGNWLDKKFGNLYEDWLLTSTVNSTKYVEEYLQSTGEMEESKYFVTLTPDAVIKPAE